MKTHLLHLVILALGLTSAFAAGPLTPPGGPGVDGSNGGPSLTETHAAALKGKTLIPAQTSTYTITQPGAYVLTGNVVVASGNGININASNVDLDLNGFQVSSTENPSEGNAIFLENNIQNVRIHDGFITSESATGFTVGVYLSSGISGITCEAMHFRRVGVDMSLNPIAFPTAVTVRNCAFVSGADAILPGGIYDSILDSTFGIASTATAGLISGCTGVTNTATREDGRFPIPPRQTTLYIGSGNYVLTGNITVTSGDGIVISDSDVTLDLNGFSVSSAASPAAGSAISIAGNVKNVVIRNGKLKGNFLNGITLDLAVSSTGDNYTFEDLQITGINGLSLAPANGSLAFGSKRVVARRLMVNCLNGIYLAHSSSQLFGKVIDCDVTTNSGLASIAAAWVGQSTTRKVSGGASSILATTSVNNLAE